MCSMFAVQATHRQAMERSVRIALGVVVERRKSTSRWQDWVWRPVSVIPGAPPVGPEGRELVHGEDWTQYLAATLPLELHRSETDAYLVNLTGRQPVIYVVLRKSGGDASDAYRPFLVTASPWEAGGYLDSGEDIVEGVPMPGALMAWVQSFVDRHHVEQPFVKRKRKAESDRNDRPGRDPALKDQVWRRRRQDG